jgi:hypothetical protein
MQKWRHKIMKKDNLLFLISGIAVGVVAGVFGSKEYWKKKFNDEADREIEDLREYYGIKTSYQRSEIGEKYDNLSENSENGRENGPLSQEVRSDIHENKKKVEPVNYNRIYTDLKDQNDEKMTEKEQNTDDFRVQDTDNTDGFDQEIADDLDRNDSEKDEYESVSDVISKEYFDDHQANKDRSPRVISAETVADLPDYYESRDLYFYANDETLTDENDEEIDDPEMIIGDCLDKYGFRENDEELMYVQNFSFGKVYEVHKKFDSYY